MFGAFFAGFGLIGEWREGVIEAERVTPASRTALLVGRLMRDVAQLFVQAADPGRLGWAMGMRASIEGVVVGIALTLLVGGACAAASNALALTTKSEDVMAPVINMVMMPVLLLSGILLPMTLGPAWLERVSDFMPFRWIVDAVRDTFAGDFGTSGMMWGTTWALVLFGARASGGAPRSSARRTPDPASCGLRLAASRRADTLDEGTADRCGREQRVSDEAGVAARLRGARRRRRPGRLGLRQPQAELRADRAGSRRRGTPAAGAARRPSRSERRRGRPAARS